MNKHFKFAIKLLISLVILFLVVRNLNFLDIKQSLLNFNLFALFLCFFLSAISLFLMTLKWRIFIDKLEKRKFFELYKIYWAGDFMSLFNLGSVGSEVYKMFSFKNKKKALGYSLIDKTYAFLWYILLFLGILIVFLLFNEFKLVHLVLSFVLYFVFVLFYITFEKKILKLNFLRKKLESFGLGKGLSKKNLFKHSFLALLFKINIFIIYSIILISFEVEFNYIFFAFLSLLSILITLPISFQGLGVREFVLINYANFIGSNQEFVITASFMIFTISLIFRVLGVIPFLIIEKKD